MMRYDGCYPSADGSSKIHYILWQPENSPVRATLQLAHGITEYIGRYEQIAAYFVQQGFAVFGNDHLGHGESLCQGQFHIYFGKKNSRKYAAQDIAQCKALVEPQFPGVPHYILAFSLGSFLLRELLIDHGDTISYDGVVLAGTGSAQPAVLHIARLLAWLVGLQNGEQNGSETIQKLMFDPYNRQFQPLRTQADWLNSVPEENDAYLQDPNCSYRITPGIFRELLLSLIYSNQHIAETKCTCPILLLSGTEDPVGENGNGLEKVRSAMEQAGLNVTMKLFPGRHDILREKCSSEVLDYLTHWLN